jgi:integrase
MTSPLCVGYYVSSLLMAESPLDSIARSTLRGFIGLSNCPALSHGIGLTHFCSPSTGPLSSGFSDYATLLLIATYGLPASEVVGITLDDIHWRDGSLRIYQRKTSSPLELPLTNEVSTAIVQHLKRTPTLPQHRRIFLRMRAPHGVLKPTAVTEIFQAVVRKSGLSVPVQGPHCIRHSLAVHLLKNGTPLKTIGDILGHRTAESTSMEVSLSIPGKSQPVKEVR